MRSFDLGSVMRTVIGVEKLLDMMQQGAESSQPNYPPYNIELLGDDKYRIIMAVAGFSKNEIEITSDSSFLKVVGKKEKPSTEQKFVHRGIADRNFEQRFQLAEHVRVEGAKFENGLLIIDFVREIPEKCKPRKIEITAD